MEEIKNKPGNPARKGIPTWVWIAIAGVVLLVGAICFAVMSRRHHDEEMERQRQDLIQEELLEEEIAAKSREEYNRALDGYYDSPYPDFVESATPESHPSPLDVPPSLKPAPMRTGSTSAYYSGCDYCSDCDSCECDGNCDGDCEYDCDDCDDCDGCDDCDW